MDTSIRLRSRGRPRLIPPQEEPQVMQSCSIMMEHQQHASPSQAASELDFAMDDDNSAGDPFGFGSLVSPILSFPFAKTNQIQLKYKANLVGEKILNPAIYLCDLCNLPIIIYGRMIPCKHVFCYNCAKKADKVCLRCEDEIFKIEKCNLGTVFMCRTESCKRTYLSQRDLEAHIKHRHVRKTDLSNRF